MTIVQQHDIRPGCLGRPHPGSVAVEVEDQPLAVVQQPVEVDPPTDESTVDPVQRTLAARIDGDFRILHAPLIVDRPETAAALRDERTNAATLERAESAGVAICGIGSIDSSLSGLVRAGYFTETQLTDLRSRGVVGDILGYLLDTEGRVMDLTENERLVALHPHRLRRVDTVIGVAAGKAKALAVLAVLRGSLVDVIVTDQATAEAALRDA